jgi:hypothetical protein
MTANVQNRKDIREAFATLIETALVGTGLPAQKVYPYRVADFKGRYSIVAVTSGKANRSKQAQVTRVTSGVNLEVHTFVLYSAPPVQSTSSPTAGSNVTILVPSTADFEVGDVVTIEDGSHTERATINLISAGVSIRVATLANAYTTPNVFWWTERDAEDREDLIEKMIADVVMDNDTNDTWAQLSFDGDTQPDPLIIGGREYLHEITPLNFRLHSD